VIVEGPTGEATPHHEAHAGSPGLDQGQLTSNLPDHTPNIGNLMRFGRRKSSESWGVIEAFLLVRRGARPGWRIASRERLFPGLVHLVFGLFFRVSGIGRHALFRLRLILFTHRNRTIERSKSFAR
jgi:hypothetical protein